ncbi:hypothetical protein Chelonae_p1393 [[Mycobacterium] chelonae subsp. bovistauri]|nr:hypothetical protein Chelonae_p1393 [Mycobacterium sp. QIA-37]
MRGATTTGNSPAQISEADRPTPSQRTVHDGEATAHPGLCGILPTCYQGVCP